MESFPIMLPPRCAEGLQAKPTLRYPERPIVFAHFKELAIHGDALHRKELRVRVLLLLSEGSPRALPWDLIVLIWCGGVHFIPMIALKVAIFLALFRSSLSRESPNHL